MSTTTLDVESLISSYETCVPSAKLVLTDFDTAPAPSETPSIVSFFTASSVVYVQFSVRVSPGSETTTIAAGC